MGALREETLSDTEWKAAHLNIWNAMFTHASVEHGTSTGLSKAVWAGSGTYTVAGEATTLAQLERKLLDRTQVGATPCCTGATGRLP